jgi:phosphohistidine phosphatase SixA
MKLILVRHSQAMEASEWGEKVELRPLSKTGIYRAIMFARALEKIYFHSFEYILSSEYTRAVQTSEILMKYLKPNHFLILDVLNPGNSTVELIKFLKKIPDTERYILAVGHHPYLEEFLQLVTDKPKESFYFKKPSMCELIIDPEKEKGKIVSFYNYDDIQQSICPIKRSEPFKVKIEELELS